MKVGPKKLEELMYLSLIGEYEYMQLNANETLIAFKGSLHFCSYFAQPICITNTKFSTDNITKMRINKFEEKVFEKETAFLKTLNKEEKFVLNKRIKLFIEDYYKLDGAFVSYKKNIDTLKLCGVIDEIQRLGAISYNDNLRKKPFEANYEPFI